MFKSTIVKYLTAFTIIILTSFLILSGIISMMIRSYAVSQKKEELAKTADALSEHISSDLAVEDLYAYSANELPAMMIRPMIGRDDGLAVLITDDEGRILFAAGGEKNVPARSGVIDLSALTEEGGHLVAGGTLGEVLPENSMIYANKIVTKGILRGYVFAASSTVEEDRLVTSSRRAVINSCLWVMLAAMIAIYFITERIIHPLRNMTAAAKTFAKGDFSARVPVQGSDEIAELGKAFNQMAESLENLEKMRNSFLASVSHDLRTPMTTISGFIDGINSGAIPPEKQEYYLGIISAEVHRLNRLVSQILDVSRLESGDRKFVFADFDVAEVARLILISFEQKIEEKKLAVVFDAQEDAMPVFADRDAIYQVIYNLCHNAIKFSREGGKLEINIFRTEKGKVCVSVYNDGQTIGKDEMTHIFERFYKTDQSRSLDKNGTGLGLYICKTIIDAHGEEIRVSADETAGSRFWFTLKEGSPVRKNRQPADGEI